ncbi:hypothetical protein [Streptomyces sp. NPDC058657]|uniref:hypothetical protein n=1 Tax=unclassified Streptomyces TaxID=2593676 RepID=UPI00364FC32A
MASFTFPPALLDAQTRLHQAWADLEELGKTLPWSAEPAEGYTARHRTPDPDTGELRYKEFPESPGYTEEQAAERERLYALIGELSEEVRGHAYWESLAGSGDLVAARSALKAAARDKAQAA